MNFEINMDDNFFNQNGVEPTVIDFLNFLPTLVNYDFSKLMITNVHELYNLMNSPEKYIHDQNVCKKVKSLRVLIKLWEK